MIRQRATLFSFAWSGSDRIMFGMYMAVSSEWLGVSLALTWPSGGIRMIQNKSNSVFVMIC